MRARKTDPQTSHEAAATVDYDSSKSELLKWLQAAGDEGLTSYEYADIIGRPVQNVSPIFKPMEREGLIRRYKLEYLFRRGETGRRRQVWVIPNPEHENRYAPVEDES